MFSLRNSSIKSCKSVYSISNITNIKQNTSPTKIMTRNITELIRRIDNPAIKSNIALIDDFNNQKDTSMTYGDLSIKSKSLAEKLKTKISPKALSIGWWIDN